MAKKSKGKKKYDMAYLKAAEIEHLATRKTTFRAPPGHNIPSCPCAVCREIYFHTAWMYL